MIETNQQLAGAVVCAIAGILLLCAITAIARYEDKHRKEDNRMDECEFVMVG